jgi:hypothetical protein
VQPPPGSEVILVLQGAVGVHRLPPVRHRDLKSPNGQGSGSLHKDGLGVGERLWMRLTSPHQHADGTAGGLA